MKHSALPWPDEARRYEAMHREKPMKSHRSYTPDHSRLILWPLMPLLAANAVMWKLYAHNGWIAAVWFLLFIGSIAWARKG